MAPTSVPNASSTVRDASKLKDKLDSVEAQIEEVRRQRELLAPKKDVKHYTKKIDHSKKPKKSFNHPKLEFVYGEVAHSPYLTKPLDPYPQSTFSVVEELRELKRKGVKRIAKLPKNKQPYDPKKIKNIFINDVINYQVSFLPKGYEDMKQREMELSQSMSQLDVGNFEETGGRERSPSPNMTEKRSQILLRNIARGGPAKYMKELKALNETREKTNLDDMAMAMLSVEDEEFVKSQRREKMRMHRQKSLEGEEFRRKAAEEGIRSAKYTANRIFEMTVPENIRSERVSSPPRLLALRRREMEEKKESQRGRDRSPDWGASTMPAPRSESPAPHAPAPEMVQEPTAPRPATTSLAESSRTGAVAPMVGEEDEQSNQRLAKDSKKGGKKKPVEEESVPLQFVVTPMNAADDEVDEEGGGNFFNFEDFGKIEPEPSPFDEIAPDVAAFGSVEDNIQSLRESIGLPEEIEEGVEDSLSAPNSRPNTSGGVGAVGRPGTSNRDGDGYRDRVGKSSGRGNRGGPGNVVDQDEDVEDVFPDYNPEADSEGEQEEQLYVDEDHTEATAGEGEGEGAGAVPSDKQILEDMAVANIAADVVAATEHVEHAEEDAIENVGKYNVAADIVGATEHVVHAEEEALEGVAMSNVDTDVSIAARNVGEGKTETEGESEASEKAPTEAASTVAAIPTIEAPTVDPTEEAPLTSAIDSPVKDDRDAGEVSMMNFEDQSHGGMPAMKASTPALPNFGEI